MNRQIELLRREVMSDREAFAERVRELEGLDLVAGSADENVLARAAVALHHAYAAIEAAWARVAQTLGTNPSGDNWHRALLETMAMDLPGIRPAIVSPMTLQPLRDLLSFRHFFRHAYRVRLNPNRLRELRQSTLAVHAILIADFDRLDAVLVEFGRGVS